MKAKLVQVNIAGNVLFVSLPGYVLSVTQENAANLYSVDRKSFIKSFTYDIQFCVNDMK